jgi:hypothetical protein
MAHEDPTGASCAIDVHTHIVPEKFPPYTGVGLVATHSGHRFGFRVR